MRWTALIPLKPAGTRKSRLAPHLDAAVREHLAAAMFAHVARVVAAVPEIGEPIVLADAVPPGWTGGWMRDRRRGLNAEIEAARARMPERPLLIIHADLPLLTPGDVLALIDAAHITGAIACDRHGSGTNALALPPGAAPRLGFGSGSLALHRLALGQHARIVRRQGLSHDLDTISDLHRIADALTSRPPHTNQAIAQIG